VVPVRGDGVRCVPVLCVRRAIRATSRAEGEEDEGGHGDGDHHHHGDPEGAVGPEEGCPGGEPVEEPDPAGLDGHDGAVEGDDVLPDPLLPDIPGDERVEEEDQEGDQEPVHRYLLLCFLIKGELPPIPGQKSVTRFWKSSSMRARVVAQLARAKGGGALSFFRYSLSQPMVTGSEG